MLCSLLPPPHTGGKGGGAASSVLSLLALSMSSAVGCPLRASDTGIFFFPAQCNLDICTADHPGQQVTAFIPTVSPAMPQRHDMEGQHERRRRSNLPLQCQCQCTCSRMQTLSDASTYFYMTADQHCTAYMYTSLSNKRL